MKQARRAADIVQNLLAFSRPRSSGLLPLRLEDIIQHILLAQRAELAKKGVEVKIDAEPGLPPVEADRKLLTQVFSNIVVNAEQAISAAKPSGTITVTIKAAGDRVCIAFENDGPPIPSDVVAKLFDPFFTTKRPGGGSGLGLTICLAIVKDHGGTIEVESPPSGGATFRIYLPAAKGAPATKLQPEGTLPAGSGLESHLSRDTGNGRLEHSAKTRSAPSKIIPALQGHSIVVVDDEESILEIVEDGLSARGLKVAAFSKALEALQHLENNSCEVVLCDFNMPGMKGSELFERVRASQGERSPRFVFMTGELVESEAIAGLRGQGALTLQKPFHIPAIADLLLTIFQPQS